jgi:hypothetical protein
VVGAGAAAFLLIPFAQAARLAALFEFMSGSPLQEK